MTERGDIERHLRDDINTDDPRIVPSETGFVAVGGSMADVIADQAQLMTPERRPTAPIDDEAHRNE